MVTTIYKKSRAFLSFNQFANHFSKPHCPAIKMATHAISDKTTYNGDQSSSAISGTNRTNKAMIPAIQTMSQERLRARKR